MDDRVATPADGYTAPAEAIPSRSASSSRTLGECFGAFAARLSPRVLAGSIVATLALRLWVGQWSWRDLVAAFAVVAIAPFFEWVVHVVVLHARTKRIGSFEFELPNARDHRIHHEDPANLDKVLIPTHVLPIDMTAVALVSVGMGSLVHLLSGGVWAPLASSSLLMAALYLSVYEWSHFLMHSPYRPKSRFFRHLWKNHRLHHYKNEHHWFGVTSTVADHVLGTAPEQTEVERSPTARSLHGAAVD